MPVYRMVKIGPHDKPAEDYFTGKIAFVPVDAEPRGAEKMVPVHLAMTAPMGIEPERLKEVTA